MPRTTKTTRGRGRPPRTDNPAPVRLHLSEAARDRMRAKADAEGITLSELVERWAKRLKIPEHELRRQP